MLKNMRLLAVVGLVAAAVALTVVTLTETTSLTADRGTRADSAGYTQLAWGGDWGGGEVSTQRSGR